MCGIDSVVRYHVVAKKLRRRSTPAEIATYSYTVVTYCLAPRQLNQLQKNKRCKVFVSLLPRHLFDCTRYLRRYSTLTNCSNPNSSNKSTILASFEWSQRLVLHIQCTEIWSIAFRCMHPFECTDTIGSCRFPVYSWTRQEIVSFVISCWVAVCAETMRCTFLVF